MAGWLLHGITHRPPQALSNLISHTLEAVEEPEHDLSTLRRYAPLPVPNPQFGELPLELGRFRDVRDLHLPDPLRYHQPRR